MANINGKRIVDFMYLFDQFQQIARHNAEKRCEFGSVYPITEMTSGLCSEVTLKCSNCNSYFSISLNDKSDGSDLNYSAVSAAEVTGLGFSGLKTLCDSVGTLSVEEHQYDKLKTDMEYYENGMNSMYHLQNDQYNYDESKGVISVKKELHKPEGKLMLKTNEIEVIPISGQNGLVPKKRVRTKFTPVFNKNKAVRNHFNFNVRTNYKEPYSEVGEVIVRRMANAGMNEEIIIKEEPEEAEEEATLMDT